MLIGVKEMVAVARATCVARGDTQSDWLSVIWLAWRLVEPAEDEDEQVGLAPPDGLKPPTATQRAGLLP